MATIPCTTLQMSKAWCKFNTAIGDKSYSQESIACLHKGMVLHYLGLIDPTDAQLEIWSTAVDVATKGAYARGWTLEGAL